MVKFIEVAPEDVPDAVMQHRGRVSYPILKGFLETGHYVAQLDRTGMQQSMQSLQMSLRSYTKSHNMPIKVFTRKGEIFLMRLDIDAEGNKIEDWDKEEGPLSDAPVVSMTPETAKQRFDDEKKKAKAAK